AVRAMEMDINTDWVSAFTYVPQDPNAFNSPIVGSKLLGGMTHDGSQYLQQSSRDFFAFTADAKLVAPLPTTTTTPTTTPKRKKYPLGEWLERVTAARAPGCRSSGSSAGRSVRGRRRTRAPGARRTDGTRPPPAPCRGCGRP